MPRTAAQIEASRQNGARSNGPRTAAGKARSSQNARRHGLRAAHLTPAEAEALRRLGENLRHRLAPHGQLQAALVSHLAAALWQVERLDAWEARLWQVEIDHHRRVRSIATLLRYRAKAEKALLQALTAFRQAGDLANRANEPCQSSAVQTEAERPNEPERLSLSSSPVLGMTVERMARTNPEQRTRPNEPKPMLNRQQRRRLAALERKAA